MSRRGWALFTVWVNLTLILAACVARGAGFAGCARRAHRVAHPA